MSTEQDDELVLIADDSKLMSDNMKKLLSQFKFSKFVFAEDGIQALHQFKKRSPALVFLDIHMPTLNGLEALRQVMKLDGDAYVIILSGESTI